MYIKINQNSNDEVLNFCIEKNFNYTKVFKRPYKGEDLFIKNLFELSEIKKVKISKNIISITKKKLSNWSLIKPKILVLIVNFLDNNTSTTKTKNIEATNSYICKNQIEKDIWKIISERVKPAIQGDGGDIEFYGIEDNIVKVRLKGACVDCPNIDITLKNGIERLLQHYFPDIKGVQNV